MRIDKYLSINTKYSRSEIKKLALKNKIRVNDELIKDTSSKINKNDVITFFGKIIKPYQNIYYVLDKPKGYISSTKDKNHKTIVELIPTKYKHLNLKPVGRLDKDTTGIIILTNDNDFIHKMTSPKNKVPKTYLVKLADPIQTFYKKKLENGIKLKDGTMTMASIFKIIDNYSCELTIYEGKYHQVKRMFGALGNKVIELRRLSFGDYHLEK